MTDNLQRRARLMTLICCCCPCPLPGGVPPIESLRRMDAETMQNVLNRCASLKPDSTLLSCCRVLKNPRQVPLSHTQELAILNCIFTTITERELKMCTILLVTDTLDKRLKNSSIFEFQRMILTCEIALVKWIPALVSSKIVSLFTVPSVPEDIVFWGLQNLTLRHVIEDLAAKFVPYIDSSLGSLLFEAYKTCKGYLQKSTLFLRQVCGQVIIVLGHLASILTADQLDMELPWVTNRIGHLLRQLSDEEAFDLMDPLQLCVNAAVTRGCEELEKALPALLSGMQHQICTASSGGCWRGEISRVTCRTLILSLARAHCCKVLRYLQNSLFQLDAHSRAMTIHLLRDLLMEKGSDDGFYRDSVLHVLKDDDQKQANRLVLEPYVAAETIKRQSAALLKKIASHQKNIDEEFWTELLLYMLDKDYTESVPAMCEMLLLGDKRSNINLKNCAKDIPSQKLFIRLLIISSFPRFDVESGIVVLALLDRLIPEIYPFLTRLCRTQIPMLIKYLEASSKSIFSLTEWKSKLVSFLTAVLEEAPSQWNTTLMTELALQIPSFRRHEHQEDLVIAFQDCANVHAFECHQVLQGVQFMLSAVEKDPDQFLEEITSHENIEEINTSRTVEVRTLQDRMKTMRNTLKFCSILIHKWGELRFYVFSPIVNLYEHCPEFGSVHLIKSRHEIHERQEEATPFGYSIFPNVRLEVYALV
ncbi:hypothetical protein NDU88_003895 [Pleurodeles waltl]|uniref:MROH2B-like HEAT-repeats domain-containing protein n=1 Tax=Pleurodeles waltl TaxID=8319 RepID=A0AAV7MCF2_PLEWA|nr:hypothetical protein NDU88_003895 [Pleurodeles waltl]